MKPFVIKVGFDEPLGHKPEDMGEYARTCSVDGEEPRTVHQSEGPPPTLAAMQAFVGGYIEIIETVDGRQIIIDEEGKLKGKPINHEATLLARGRIMPTDFICGDVLVLSGDAKVD